MPCSSCSTIQWTTRPTSNKRPSLVGSTGVLACELRQRPYGVVIFWGHAQEPKKVPREPIWQ
jgi:hypothetical protein